MSLSDYERVKVKRLLVWYNTVPTVLWSILNIVPVYVFCYRYAPHTMLLVFIAVSLLPIFLPNAFFNKIQLAKTSRVYRKLKVDVVNRLVQNGSYVNTLIRKKYPEYKAIAVRKSSVKKIIGQTYINEKFHFVLFVFYCLITALAIKEKMYGWAALIILTNLIYNVYPNLLQQYIRIKLSRYQTNG